MERVCARKSFFQKTLEVRVRVPFWRRFGALGEDWIPAGDAGMTEGRRDVFGLKRGPDGEIWAGVKGELSLASPNPQRGFGLARDSLGRIFGRVGDE